MVSPEADTTAGLVALIACAVMIVCAVILGAWQLLKRQRQLVSVNEGGHDDLDDSNHLSPLTPMTPVERLTGLPKSSLNPQEDLPEFAELEAFNNEDVSHANPTWQQDLQKLQVLQQSAVEADVTLAANAALRSAHWASAVFLLDSFATLALEVTQVVSGCALTAVARSLPHWATCLTLLQARTWPAPEQILVLLVSRFP
eukprot:g30483.t1